MTPELATGWVQFDDAAGRTEAVVWATSVKAAMPHGANKTILLLDGGHTVDVTGGWESVVQLLDRSQLALEELDEARETNRLKAA